MLAAGLALITSGMPASEVQALATARSFLSQFDAPSPVPAPAQLAMPPQQRWQPPPACCAKLGCFPSPALWGELADVRRFLAAA